MESAVTEVHNFWDYLMTQPDSFAYKEMARRLREVLKNDEPFCDMVMNHVLGNLKGHIEPLECARQAVLKVNDERLEPMVSFLDALIDEAKWSK